MSEEKLEACRICSTITDDLTSIHSNFILIDNKKINFFILISDLLKIDLSTELAKICDSCVSSLKTVYHLRQKFKNEQNKSDVKQKIFNLFDNFWEKHKDGCFLVTETNQQLAVQKTKIYSCSKCHKVFKNKHLRMAHEADLCENDQQTDKKEKIPKLTYTCLTTYFDGSEEEESDEEKDEDDFNYQTHQDNHDIQQSVPSSSNIGGGSKFGKESVLLPNLEGFSHRIPVKEEHELSLEEFEMEDNAADISERQELDTFQNDSIHYKDDENSMDKYSQKDSSCRVCEQNYQNHDELFGHLRREHPELIICDDDYKKFEQAFEINGVSTLIYQCNECSYSTKIKGNFKRHLLLKARSRFKKKKFRNIRKSMQSDYVTIKNKDNGNESTYYKCKFCTYMSNIRCNILRHMRLIHKYVPNS